MPRDRFDVVRRDYYSPIPNLALLSDHAWGRRSDLSGVTFDSAAGIDFVENQLRPFIAEMEVPRDDPTEPGRFFLRNQNFESVDAELLYSMVRALRPTRVVELGSGYSTLLIGMAAKSNSQDGTPTQHIAYDPYPREHVLGASVPEPTRLEKVSATDVPMTVFTDLDEGDILFVELHTR